MSTKNSSGGANDGSSGTGGQGAGGTNQSGSGGTNDDSDDDGDTGSSTGTVSREAYLKAVTESKSRAKRLRDAETELANLRASQTENERKKLEEQGEYKKLLESERLERQKEREKTANLEKEVSEYKDRDVARKKFSALNASIGGKIDPAYAPLIDWEQIVVDPDTGEVDSTSVARYAEAFKKKFPAVVVTASGTGLPNGAPGAGGRPGGAKKILASEFAKLSTAEMRKYRPEDVIE